MCEAPASSTAADKAKKLVAGSGTATRARSLPPVRLLESTSAKYVIWNDRPLEVRIEPSGALANWPSIGLLLLLLMM